MRKRLWLAGLLLSFALGAPLWSQTGDFHIGSYNPQRIVNKPIDVSHPVAPVPAARTGKFNLSNIFSKFRRPNFKRTSATGPLPPTGSFPGTKNPNSSQPSAQVMPQH